MNVFNIVVKEKQSTSSAAGFAWLGCWRQRWGWASVSPEWVVGGACGEDSALAWAHAVRAGPTGLSAAVLGYLYQPHWRASCVLRAPSWGERSFEWEFTLGFLWISFFGSEKSFLPPQSSLTWNILLLRKGCNPISVFTGIWSYPFCTVWQYTLVLANKGSFTRLP